MAESKDTMWFSYRHRTEDGKEQYLKVLFDGFGFEGMTSEDWEKHPRYTMFRKYVQVMAKKVFGKEIERT